MLFRSSGKYLDVYGGTDSNGQNVQQYGVNGGNGQKWKVAFLGSGLYKLISMCSPSGRVLDIQPGDNTEGGNVDIYTDYGYDDMRFHIVTNSDGYSYRILSQCSNYTKAVTVQGASCASSANVYQYTYNRSTNDEWIFEPVYNYSTDLGVNYALQNYNKQSVTYPDITPLGGDCANFASQCLLAGGIHFQDYWWIYKKNNTYPAPSSTSQLNNSWDLSDPSPWISAAEFKNDWSSKLTTHDYTAQYILDNPDEVYNSAYYIGDIIQILHKDWLGNFQGYHTMYISSYGIYNGNYSFQISAHTTDRADYNLLSFCSEYLSSDYTFRFYRFG